jgi:hypothetical protein
MSDDDYALFYASNAVAQGFLTFCNMGMHPCSTFNNSDSSSSTLKRTDALQPHQTQLYRTLLSAPPISTYVAAHQDHGRPLEVLEVGCGIGAGLPLIHEALMKHMNMHPRAPPPQRPQRPTRSHPHHQGRMMIAITGIDKCEVAIQQHKKLMHYHPHHKSFKVLTNDLNTHMDAFSCARFDLIVGVQSFQECNTDTSIRELQVRCLS